MTEQAFKRAKEIKDEQERLIHERINVGKGLGDYKPSKEIQEWLDELRGKLDAKIKDLQQEFENL